MKINNAVQHDVSSVLKRFKNYYPTLAENLAKLLSNPDNKYSINSVIKYYEHLIQGNHFNLASFSKSSILTILKATQVLKAAGLDNLSGCFVKGDPNFSSKPISD